MKSVKKEFIIGIVVLCCFCLLSTGLMQPIQTAKAMETISDKAELKQQIEAALSDISIDITPESENRYIVSVGNKTMILELLENCQRISTILDSGEIITYDIAIKSHDNDEASSKNSWSAHIIPIINGTEYNIPLNQFIQPSTFEYPYELPSTRGIVNYWWDGVYFYEDSSFWNFDYPHPDKTYYNINPSNDWFKVGNNKIHVQINAGDSSHILNVGGSLLAAVVCTVLDVALSFAGLPGVLTLFSVDLIVGALLSWYYGLFFTDEDGCIWVWLGWNVFSDLLGTWGFLEYWFQVDPYGAQIYVEDYVREYGYFRVGHLTLIGVGGPAPPPPHKDIIQIIQAPGYGSGYVSNPTGAMWSPPDNNLALIYGMSSGAGGQIIGRLSGVSQGHIWVYAGSVHGYNTRLYVYVSSNNINWYPAPISSVVVQGGTGMQWVDFGVCYSNFEYIGIAAINNQGQPVNIYIDSAIVVPY
ncbi:MAG: hypothetical protein LBE76_09170 [Nitrososphaerota archaeon]|nr:hypothetical protein [Nitrososphaerota archaeon]